MTTRIGIGLLGLGTVGAGVASILDSPDGRHPLISDLDLVKVAVRDLKRKRALSLDESILTTSPESVVDDPEVDVVVEVMGDRTSPHLDYACDICRQIGCHRKQICDCQTW